MAEYRRWACHDVEPTDLKLGDHIYVWGALGMHTHHGIVTNVLDQPSLHNIPLEDRIIVTHFSPVHSNSFPFKNVMNILRGEGSVSLVYAVPLRDFIGPTSAFGGLKRARYNVPSAEYWLKRAGTCYREVADPADVSLCRARMLLDEHNRLEQVYSVRTAMTANCEHMAFWCKTGIWRSSQIAQLPSQLFFIPPKIMGGALSTFVTTAVTFLDENLPAFPLPDSPRQCSEKAENVDVSCDSDTPAVKELSEVDLHSYPLEREHVEEERRKEDLEKNDEAEQEQMIRAADLFYADGQIAASEILVAAIEDEDIAVSIGSDYVLAGDDESLEGDADESHMSKSSFESPIIDDGAMTDISSDNEYEVVQSAHPI